MLVFVSSTFYALCIETNRNFVNQNKKEDNSSNRPMVRMSFAMSWHSGSFQLKNSGKQKSKITLRVEINHFCDG